MFAADKTANRSILEEINFLVSQFNNEIFKKSKKNSKIIEKQLLETSV